MSWGKWLETATTVIKSVETSVEAKLVEASGEEKEVEKKGEEEGKGYGRQQHHVPLPTSLPPLLPSPSLLPSPPSLHSLSSNKSITTPNQRAPSLEDLLNNDTLLEGLLGKPSPSTLKKTHSRTEQGRIKVPRNQGVPVSRELFKNKRQSPGGQKTMSRESNHISFPKENGHTPNKHPKSTHPKQVQQPQKTKANIQQHETTQSAEETSGEDENNRQQEAVQEKQPMVQQDHNHLSLDPNLSPLSHLNSPHQELPTQHHTEKDLNGEESEKEGDSVGVTECHPQQLQLTDQLQHPEFTHLSPLQLDEAQLQPTHPQPHHSQQQSNEEEEYNTEEPEERGESGEREERERQRETEESESQTDLPSSSPLPSSLSHLHHQISLLTSVLEERERQIESLSGELGTMSNKHSEEVAHSDALSRALALEKEKNMELQKSNNNFRDANTKLERELTRERIKNEEIDLDGMKQEFSSRLGHLERNNKNLSKERDEARKQLRDNEKLLAEKDDIILQLRSEGENLSKKQLTLEGTTKKLRITEKENEELIKNLQSELEIKKTQVLELDKLVQSLRLTQSKYTDTLSTMKEASEDTAKQLEEKHLLTETSQQRIRELEAALERAWKEIAELKKQLVIACDSAESAVLEATSNQKKHYEDLLKKHRKELKEKESAFSKTISKLRLSVSRITEESQWKEDNWRKENQLLQRRLQAAEDRNEELSLAVPDATRPLLRQIDSIMASHSKSIDEWTQLELALNRRLEEEEKERGKERERNSELRMENSDLKRSIGSLEKQVEALRGRNKGLLEELDSQKDIVEDFRSKAQANTVKLTRLEKKKEELLKEKEKLEDEVQQYKQGGTIASEHFLPFNSNTDHPPNLSDPPSPSNPNSNNTPNGGATSQSDRDSSDSDFNDDSSRTPSSDRFIKFNNDLNHLKKVVGEEHKGGYHIQMLEANILQKNGELRNLMNVVKNLEKQKGTLEDELVTLTTKNEELMEEVSRLNKLAQEVNEIKGRYMTALDMLGEKSERVEELTLDLQDMKDLYRTQISELTFKIEQLEKKNTP